MNWKMPAAPFGPGMHARIWRRIKEEVAKHWRQLGAAQGWADLVRLGAAREEELAELLGRDASEAERALVDEYVRARVRWHERREG